MGLNDFFRKRREPKAPPLPSLGFWLDLETMCRRFVPRMIDYFRSHKPFKLDWAAEAYEALVTQPALDALMATARNGISAARPDWQPVQVRVGRFASWSVWAVVAPTPSDAGFLERCPDGRFEAFMENCARQFRESEEDWKGRNYALWILLLDPPESDASVHLFTMWSLNNHLGWLKEGSRGIFPSPPTIVSIELIREDVSEFINRLVRQQLIACDARPASADSIGKMLFLESAVSESPASFESPIHTGPLSLRNGDWLDGVLRAHRIDCDQLQFDVPLWIGLAERCRQQVEAYCREVRYHGLNPRTVSFFPEAELPWLDMDFRLSAGSDLYKLPSYLAGGGLSMAQWMEEGGLAQAWRLGIRWLFLGQVGNLGARLEPAYLKIVSKPGLAGIMELVERTVMPTSLLVAARKGDRTICVDERRLRSKEMEHLRNGEVVGTGSFWINLSSLASQYGIGKGNLEEQWDASSWKDKISGPLLERQIACFHEGKIGLVVPLWEILSDLNMEAVKVRPDRFQAK
jgi:hypothetical protein